MPIRNSIMQPGNTPAYRALNLSKVGIPNIPIIYFVRHKQHLEPVQRHCHKDCFEVGLCLRGRFVLENDNSQYNILAGDLFVNNPDVAHRMLDYPKGTVLYGMLLRTDKQNLLRFTKAESSEIRKRLYQLPPHLTVNSNSVKHSFIDIFRKYETLQGRYRRLYMMTACMNLVTNLLEASRQPSSPSHADRINKIIDNMRDAPEKPYDVDTLAHQAALSPSHFITQFKRLTGLPPHHFLIKCRLDEAKIRLRKTRLPITHIALDLGFCSSQHFASHFKRTTGMTPLVWRKQKLQKENDKGRNLN
ncbi:MAG: AraC family transcriptional regulator [Kiritimatiellae bacterium]|jgi:AraC family L-rhamnose operon regulatory protein RhaS|nr:AraC family transcriptional regulator [Kiritimatiellia bacterium]